jgi:hypothetical protein
LKRPGPRHTFAEKELMKQVAEVFSQRWKELGTATKAAKELGINPKSFYKYASGDDLPRIEVLRAAQDKWKVKWKLNLMPIALFRKVKPKLPEQLLLPLIQSVREEDIEVVEVVTGADSSLRVKLKIHFSVGPQTKIKTPVER